MKPSQKIKRIFLRFCKRSKEALQKKMVSSTSYNINTLALFLLTKKPSVNPFSFSLNINILRTSTTSVKRKGERGSPCLKPLDAFTEPLALLLTRIEKLVKERQPLIQYHRFGFDPFLSETCSKKPQST